MLWTLEQVLALAPDAASAKSGKELSASRKWMTLGATESCAWGTIQGSGKDPYQASIDLAGPAFKCSCPSRKFPCKHGLGLFLILAREPATLTGKTPPAWTTEWLAKRAGKDGQNLTKSAAPETSPDPAAATKSAAASESRIHSRESKVTAGLEEFGLWLDDLVRSGLAALPMKPSGFWEHPVARLVDAQAPGLARRAGALAGITTTGERWPNRFLGQAALLHLVREGWSRLDTLPPSTQADLRATIGFTADQEDVLSQSGVRDRWFVIGQRVVEEERLRTQRTWLLGATGRRPALCLSFSAGPNQPLDVSLVPGTCLEAELVFFPSAWPLRALVKQRHGPPESAPPVMPHESIAAALAFAGEALAANPWIERVPLALPAVIPVRRAEGWGIRDAEARTLPMTLSEARTWVLVSLSGGHPISLAGEWDGGSLTPLSAWAEGRFVRI